MAKPNLLEYVQSILSDMDADEVNSISDTIEAQQVANVIRNVYRQIIEEYDLQATEIGFKLHSGTADERPTHMAVPENISDVVHVSYDCRAYGAVGPSYQTIPYTTNEDFLAVVQNYNTSDTTYDTVTDPGTGFVLGIRNDSAPSMWTSFDGGETLIFNSYDKAVDDCLQQSKNQCLGRRRLDITIEDTATFNIPEHYSQLVMNEAREMCFDLFKDGAPRNLIERSRISRMKAKERKKKINTPARLRLPDYGR